ncbi:MAG: type I-U CRISPR-associated protein Csb2 [Streptosporangiaceae bacterium]
MPTTLTVRFPLGQYHANPWDRSVNEGATEWPPSPWRLLRALVATWHTRWPDLPAPIFDGLLDALSDPPSYWTPSSLPAHTRHYLPNLDHKSGLPDARKQRPKSQENDPSGKDLALDPFIRLSGAGGPDAELLIQWPTDLGSEHREVLAKLAELLPYLGRADSVCEARLLDTNRVPDESWWRPEAPGQHRIRLLAPSPPVRRTTLETSTAEVHRQHRTLPPGTAWIRYSAGKNAPARSRSPKVTTVAIEAVRFAVTGRAPLKATHGVLLADAVHRVAGNRLAAIGVNDTRRGAILGTGGAATNHGHAHWVPIPEGTHRGAAIAALVLWIPDGLASEEVAGIITLPQVSGRLGGRGADEGYEVRGFPPVRLLFQGAGTIAQMAPELCRQARHWQSLTPYLPVRHRKREKLIDFLTADINTELGYRAGLRRRARSEAVVSQTDPDGGLPDRWARDFRRYRLTERMHRSRPGLSLRLQFPEEVPGPLLLGQLSHFGYGVFIPESS